jgi:hypothetical protein
MAAAVIPVVAALGRLRREPFADLGIGDQLDQLCRSAGHVWRRTLLTPMATLRLFMLQVLHGNTSIAHVRQLCGVGFAPASYCQARQRLPPGVLRGLLGRMIRWAEEERLASSSSPAGPRVLVVDGSSFSMSDTPALRQHFGLPPGVRPGVGYPVAKLLGLLDAATGLFVEMLALPLFVHDVSRVARLHATLRAGDVLLGDRAFCSYAHVALLNAAGVFACFRLHQRRKTTARRGVDRWRRGQQPPVWMTAAQWAALPEWIDVRIVRYTIAARGHRTRHVTLATTLMDESLWPEAKLAEWYGRRWEIETCFDHLKTTMRMNVLKCQSVEGVLKELAVYLIVYNLVRLAMLRQSLRRTGDVRCVGEISFADAMRFVCCRMLGLGGVERLLLNPRRPGRRAPRVVRRRPKEYNLMKRPRAELKSLQTYGENR